MAKKKQKTPELGFYYYFARDRGKSKGDVTLQAFELTEITNEWEGISGLRVIIRPLFGPPRKAQDLPLETFLGFAKPGLKRFERITDRATVSTLEKRSREMYPAAK